MLFSGGFSLNASRTKEVNVTPDQSGTPEGTPAQDDVDERLAAVDGVNGAAGHELEDPYLRELLRKRIAGEITSEQYRELGMRHLREQEPG